MRRLGHLGDGDGWRTVVDDGLVLLDEELGVEQRLELETGCSIDAVTMDPPRVMLRCSDIEGRILWSPERVVHVPREVMLGSYHWGRNQHVLEITRHSARGSKEIGTKLIDVVELRAYSHNYRAISLVTPYAMDRGAIFTYDDNRLFAIDMGVMAAYRLPVDVRGCVYFDSPSSVSSERSASLLFPYDCYREGGRSMWTEIADLETHRFLRLPPLRDAWIVEGGQAVIAIPQRSDGRRLVRWNLR